MVDMIFLEIALAFVIVATVATVATTERLTDSRGRCHQDSQWQPNRCPLGGADRLVLLLAAGIDCRATKGFGVLVGSRSLAGRPQGAKHPWPRMKL